MTASQSAPSSWREQHRYPPAASSSTHPTQTQSLDTDNTTYGPETISYIIHTETNSISDLRLQVSQEASSSKQPLCPVYFRERVLTEQNEIVDNIVDANTGRICWTIHRPTRGWYLYLRSPVLPQGTAISIRAGKRDENDPTASPLTFSVNTKVWMHALKRVKPKIGLEPSISNRDEAQSSSTSASIDTPDRGLTIQAENQSTEGSKQDVAIAATGRENRKTTSGGHARRRSGATGSGTHTLSSQHPSKRPSSAVTSRPMIPEIDDQDHPPTHQPANPSLSRLGIPTTTTSSTSSPLSASGADRPYSPTQPSTSTFPTSPLAPRTSTFVITDSKPPTSQSWARWACSILPSEIRPSLSLDGDKSFSLYWVDPPLDLAKDRGVEVVKFEDQSGRWMWNSHTRGRLRLQTSAMQAVGLEEGFWVAAALAYVQFLEERDGYDAARNA